MINKMNDLISRQAVIDAIEKNAYRHTYLDQIIEIINSLPSASTEQKKGEWIWNNLGVYCSACMYKLQTTGLPSYCPNCYAEMKGEYDG